MQTLPPLPVDEVIPAVLSALSAGARGVVLVAPPGAGKTTRLPLRLAEALPLTAGEVLVVEPRRLAARLAAEHVAECLGEPVGERIGYAVRFESRRSAQTRVCFLTGGVLLRRLRDDPQLRGVAAVLFDEFHERHSVDETLLAWVMRLRQSGGPAVAVMSATLAGGAIAAPLGLPLVESLGRQYPVEVEHAERSDTRNMALQVRVAVEAQLQRPDCGDVLVFLPGVRAIEACAGALAEAARGQRLAVLPLHASLGPAETRDTLRRRTDGTRRVILSTNVAESSVTLDGVRTVIDTGLHNVARTNPWTGLTALVEEPIPRDSADQRAGRAGRQAPGRCVRLYTALDAERRPPHLDPELQRSDLSDLVLTLATLGVHSADALPWLAAPPAEAWQRAADTLSALGALSEPGARLTALGRRMAELSVHPRLARLALFAAERGAPGAGAWGAAVLSEDVRLPTGEPDGDSDVWRLVRLARRRSERRVSDVARDLGRTLTAAVPRGVAPLADDGDASATVLREALLHSFPDRVARRREQDPKRFMVAGGGDMWLSDASTVRHGDWVVAVEGVGGARPLIRLASAIEPDWVLGLPDAERWLSESVDVRWNDRTERVEAWESMRYRGLSLERRSLEPRGRPEASACLRDAVRSAGLARFTDAEALEKLMLRRNVAALSGELPPFDAESLEAVLDEVCQGAVSFKGVREANVLERVRETLSYRERARLDVLAPERVELPSGRSAPVKYVAEGPPRVSARIQHLFGLTDTPRIAGGKVKLLVELLAPNQRPVQLTDDLAGFWARTWLEVRKELRGRYPKHAWPEDPRRVVKADP